MNIYYSLFIVFLFIVFYLFYVSDVGETIPEKRVNLLYHTLQTLHEILDAHNVEYTLARGTSLDHHVHKGILKSCDVASLYVLHRQRKTLVQALDNTGRRFHKNRLGFILRNKHPDHGTVFVQIILLKDCEGGLLRPAGMLPKDEWLYTREWSLRKSVLGSMSTQVLVAESSYLKRIYGEDSIKRDNTHPSVFKKISGSFQKRFRSWF